jgi:transposase-like protein
MNKKENQTNDDAAITEAIDLLVGKGIDLSTMLNGLIKIDVPRDREAKFEPALIPKRQTRVDGLDQKILSLYAKGMSLSDIKIQIEELYGAEISESLISKITDDVMDDVKAWKVDLLNQSIL